MGLWPRHLVLFFLILPRMDTAAYISSGILETYCLGLASAAEALQVEGYAKLYPAVQTEIDNIMASLEEYAMINRIDPTGGNKIKLLLALYQQVCGTGKVYPPLIKENTTADDLKK